MQDVGYLRNRLSYLINETPLGLADIEKTEN